MWKHLVETGFLGTERKQILKEQLPVEIQKIVENRSGNDKENQFLTTLSFAQYYNEAGEMPKTFEGDVEGNSLEEDRQEISYQMHLLFGRINNLDTSFVKTKLIDQWLEAIINNQQVVGYALFKELIEYGKNKSKEIKGKIARVLSKNALRAAIEFNHLKEDWIPQILEEEVWYTGKIADRKNLLAFFLEENTTKAISLLEETWKQETMINKVSFLKLIYENPNQQIIPFLEMLYTTEYVFKEDEKEKQREGRSVLAKILLMFPSTTLCQETLEQLVPFFTKRSLINRLKYKLNFPLEQGGSFWIEKSMLQKYGIGVEGYLPFFHALREEDWMAYFIRFIPLSAFATALKCKEEDVFACFFDGKEIQRKEKHSDAIQPLFFNELLTKVKESKTEVSKTLAQAFITRSKKNKSKYDFRDLIFFTTTKECEELIIENKIYRTAMSVICSYAWEISDHIFSDELSYTFLEKLFANQEDWVYMAGADKLGLVLSTGLLKDLETFQTKVQKINLSNTMDNLSKEEVIAIWKNKVHIPIKEVLEIRLQLEKEKRTMLLAAETN